MDTNKQFKLVLNQCETINLKKMKIDTLLLVVNFLLNDYKKVSTDQSLDPMIICASKEELELIDRNISDLQEYLNNNIITSDTLFYIFKNQNQSALFAKLSRNLEPMKMYYKNLTNIFATRLKKGAQWIPELLAFSLIYNFKKEHEKSFMNYPYIDNFPIEKLINIYNKNNLELKKRISQRDNVSIWKIKTNLDDMYDVSEVMIKKYLEFNFKINEKRVSKTRVKKKKQQIK